MLLWDGHILKMNMIIATDMHVMLFHPLTVRSLGVTATVVGSSNQSHPPDVLQH